MGANGSHANGSTDSELGRKWRTIATIGEIQIVQQKDCKKSVKLPEESHTPNRIYAVFNKMGNDVHSIAKYGSDGKKLWEIHTDDHHGLKPHCHPWEDGNPLRTVNRKGQYDNIAMPLDKYQWELLQKVRNYGR